MLLIPSVLSTTGQALERFLNLTSIDIYNRFTIFINLDQSFAAGLSQVLFSMTVIELSKPGQEATVYELRKYTHTHSPIHPSTSPSDAPLLTPPTQTVHSHLGR